GLEWNLVQGDRATMGPYNYTKHFVEPNTLVIQGQSPITSFYLGTTVVSLMVAATLLLIAKRRGTTPEQRRLVVAMWVVLGVCTLMLSAASAPLWAALPLLELIQFPWRFMLVITVASAALAGSIAMWPSVALVLGVASLLAAVAPLRPVVMQRHIPSTTAD